MFNNEKLIKSLYETLNEEYLISLTEEPEENAYQTNEQGLRNILLSYLIEDYTNDAEIRKALLNLLPIEIIIDYLSAKGNNVQEFKESKLNEANFIAVPSNIIQKFNKIASEVADIKTLKTQNSDSLDFHDLSVWTIEQLMYRAYLLGKNE